MRIPVHVLSLHSEITSVGKFRCLNEIAALIITVKCMYWGSIQHKQYQLRQLLNSNVPEELQSAIYFTIIEYSLVDMLSEITVVFLIKWSSWRTASHMKVEVEVGFLKDKDVISIKFCICSYLEGYFSSQNICMLFVYAYQIHAYQIHL